ncbi:DUF5682 family protein [Mastigocoleus sp. MO_188.B34]|uniref:DUF5682 family protein n=1 Tax=Mastigocoleus sp. MO_188.B34 TaxID=3036635 RepID=UPI002635B029|nr:DUF5682 family protein [Mastigocoleus sp. MO_188.B34]MDJ0693033.1 DUF5682 family protein [Mastigocoleus sp. MO_188.B34]
MTIHVFGIRHHGSGSARSLRQALEELQPDTILIEGPPDAEPLLPLIASSAMEPPVALLIYQPDLPQESVYYPFAVFSPEWQAIQHGLSNNIPVGFMDLPQTHRLALKAKKEELKKEELQKKELQPESPSPEELENEELEKLGSHQIDPERLDLNQVQIPPDPLSLLAEAAGYSDGERWWEHMVETRSNSVDLFAAILEAMIAVRQELPPSQDPMEAKREAYMRKTIRQAQKSGFERIAVVCGAWHAPALSSMPPAKEDTALLKGLPKTKVEVTWIPWTYGRLAYSSGYGAGIESPGWYHHLWQGGTKENNNFQSSNVNVTISWMTRVARLLREQDLDASSAHVIEAVRLAESLAALRNRPLPGLPELNEATQTVLCFGSSLPMQLIHDKLIVGECLGKVPEETPMVPLQKDLTRQQKRLRIPPQPTEKTYDLDLRKENDLARSHLLHRLNLLDIPWGKFQQSYGKKGTFHEYWNLIWHPEFAVNLIEAGIWGNTIRDAAAAKACDRANNAEELPVLTDLLDKVILSDLPDAVNHLMSCLENAAALASDVTHLMAALPPLANVMRYGNVRQTDTTTIAHVVDGLVARICIGLPAACSSLDDDAAVAMYENLMKVNGAIGILQNQEHVNSWQQVLVQMVDNPNLHGLIAGRCCRLLLDADVFEARESARRMGLALSVATEPPQAAAWVEGFLKGSGLLVLHDDNLWQVIDDWVTQLPEETFINLLPLLRRTFATFTQPERRQMGERVRRGTTGKDKSVTTDNNDFSEENAVVVLPIIKQLLGV